MTEEEWLVCADPEKMLAFLMHRGGRKFRLFAVACVRRFWHLVVDERVRAVVDASELYAEGLLREGEMLRIQEAAWPIYEALQNAREAAQAALSSDAGVLETLETASTLDFAVEATAAACIVAHRSSFEAAKWALRYTKGCVKEATQDILRREQAAQLRDIFVFRPCSFETEWTNFDLQAIAQAAYDHRILPAGNLELVRLTILADALEDAGCQASDILNHLRSPGPHVLGCWPLDLVLGKS